MGCCLWFSLCYILCCLKLHLLDLTHIKPLFQIGLLAVSSLILSFLLRLAWLLRSSSRLFLLNLHLNNRFASICYNSLQISLLSADKVHWNLDLTSFLNGIFIEPHKELLHLVIFFSILL